MPFSDPVIESRIMPEQNPDKILQAIAVLDDLVPSIADLSNDDFERVMKAWHHLNEKRKDAALDPANIRSREEFEYGWGANSIQHMIDCIPEFHRILLKHYRRKDTLDLLDVGAGSASGSNLITQLHSSNYVYSKINVAAVDYKPLRKRWVQAMYPLVDYRVANLFDLEDKKWDIVICNAVLEHVPRPKQFCEQLIRVCRGFAFVFVPYNEINRIRSHINSFTEEFFDDFNVENIKIMKSMAWHPDRPDDMMLLATLDCRS